MALFDKLRNQYTQQSSSSPDSSNFPLQTSGIPPSLFIKGGLESDRVTAEKTQCETTTVNGIQIPMPPIISPVDVSYPAPASLTTSQRNDLILINTVLANPDLRFSEYFPPPIPPPFNLVVHPYRFSNEPRARSRGCVGIKTVGKPAS